MHWELVNADAVWPEVHLRSKGERHDYRIYFDPGGEHITFPGHALGEDLWALVIREEGDDGVYRHVRHSVHRSLIAAQRAAEQWEQSH